MRVNHRLEPVDSLSLIFSVVNGKGITQENRSKFLGDISEEIW